MHLREQEGNHGPPCFFAALEKLAAVARERERERGKKKGTERERERVRQRESGREWTLERGGLGRQSQASALVKGLGFIEKPAGLQKGVGLVTRAKLPLQDPLDLLFQSPHVRLFRFV